MFAEEHELLKGSIFVLECKPPNTVHSAIRCIGHSPELEVENKKTLCLCSKQKFKPVPHFAFGGLRPLSHSPLEVKSRRGNVAQEVRPSAIDSGHINH